MRFMKNSSRFEVKMAKNLALSSSGVRWSDASASTRSLNSSQLRSRSIQTSESAEDTSWLRIPSSPIDTITGAAHIFDPSEITSRWIYAIVAGSWRAAAHANHPIMTSRLEAYISQPLQKCEFQVRPGAISRRDEDRGGECVQVCAKFARITFH